MVAVKPTSLIARETAASQLSRVAHPRPLSNVVKTSSIGFPGADVGAAKLRASRVAEQATGGSSARRPGVYADAERRRVSRVSAEETGVHRRRPEPGADADAAKRSADAVACNATGATSASWSGGLAIAARHGSSCVARAATGVFVRRVEPDADAAKRRVDRGAQQMTDVTSASRSGVDAVAVKHGGANVALEVTGSHYRRVERTLVVNTMHNNTISMSNPFYTVHSTNHIVVTTPAEFTNLSAPASGLTEPTLPPRAERASEATEKRWRKKLGQFFAMDVIKPEWEAQGRAWPRRVVQGRLQAFPTGFVLLTVPRADDSERRDHQLRSASSTLVFRSPEEFGPHLAWILTGQPRDAEGDSACECCYCSGVPQEVVRKRYDSLHELFLGCAPKAPPRARKSRAGSSSSTGSSTASPRSRNLPIMAKDYTQLNVGSTEGGGYVRVAM